MPEAKILSGKNAAQAIFDSLKPKILSLNKRGVNPGLCVILVGDDTASKIYVRTKTKKLKSLGLVSETISLSEDVSQEKLIKIIDDLNKDTNYHGILVQLPLPRHINPQKIISAISPRKDVDGFHPENVGWLSIGKPRFIPCTPKGIMKLLEHYEIDLCGRNIVVIGRSNIVGRPISILTSLNTRGANGTCTLCHSRTENLENYTKTADLVISATGIPNYLKGGMIKKGSILVDVGINRIDTDKEKGYYIVGDADWNSVIDKVSAITPVPGGVGPMTICMLVENTIEAAENYG